MEGLTIGPIGSAALLLMMLYALGELLWITVVNKQVSFRHDYSQVVKNMLLVNFTTVFLPLLGSLDVVVYGRVSLHGVRAVQSPGGCGTAEDLTSDRVAEPRNLGHLPPLGREGR